MLPRARIRSAMASLASQSSLYCSSNIRCSVWNIGPTTFQWKLCVFKYNVNVSANTRDSASATCASAFSVIAFSIPIALDISFLSSCLKVVIQLNFIAQWPRHYDYQHKVDSKTTKPCYHAPMTGVFTVICLEAVEDEYREQTDSVGEASARN